MSVSAITNAVAGYVKQVTSGGSVAQGSASSAMQEAQETPAVTAKEAARGDRQAKLKLARDQQAQQAQQDAQKPAPLKEAGKGEMVDHPA